MKPILFNTAMVRAILDGRKTVTRRVIKPQPSENAEMRYCFAGGRKGDVGKWSDWQQGVMDAPKWTPPFHADDILYVRETWCDPSETGYPIMYKADMPIHYNAEDTEIGEPIDLRAEDYAWNPSIHMPRDYARIFLRATDVRVERLHDIMDDPPGPNNQIVREGCKYGCDFIALWDSTIKKADMPLYGWDANPWVWVIEFERINMCKVCEKITEANKDIFWVFARTHQTGTREEFLQIPTEDVRFCPVCGREITKEGADGGQ